MRGQQDIFFSEGRLCLRLTDNVNAMKGYELPQQKQPAMLFRNGQLFDVDWHSIQPVEDSLCLTFVPTELFSELPVSSVELSASLKGRAIELITNLSYALEAAEDRIDWNFSSVPLSSFYFLSDGSVLLMSAQIADVIDRFSVDEQRFDDREKWYAHNCVNDFGKAHFLFQLVYYACTGSAPFQSTVVRESGFRPIPMHLFFSKDNSRIQRLCMETEKALSGNKKIMFQTRDPYRYFRDAIAASASELTLQDITPAQNPDMDSYMERRKKKASVTVFLRKKGLVTAFIILAAAAVIGIAGYYIKEAVRAPLTKDLDEIQIIQYYYDAVTRLDVTELKEPLKNGYDGPDLTEVSTLFVNGAMQQAYGGARTMVDARTWLEQGMPALSDNANIFGVTEFLSFQKLSEDVVRATFILYSPTDYYDNTLMTEDMTFSEIPYAATVHVYEQTVDFTFRTRRTWREVTNINTVELKELQVIDVPYLDR